MKYREKSSECSRTGCDNPRRPNQRTCRKCHAEDSRKYRSERVFVKRSELQESR